MWFRQRTGTTFHMLESTLDVDAYIVISVGGYFSTITPHSIMQDRVALKTQSTWLSGLSADHFCHLFKMYGPLWGVEQDNNNDHGHRLLLQNCFFSPVYCWHKIFYLLKFSKYHGVVVGVKTQESFPLHLCLLNKGSNENNSTSNNFQPFLELKFKVTCCEVDVNQICISKRVDF